MSVRTIAESLSRAHRVIVRHEVRRTFRLLSLLEWSAWLLTTIVLFPIVIALFLMGAMESGGGDRSFSSEGGGGGSDPEHGGAGAHPEQPASRGARRCLAPHEEHSRFFHYLHRLTVDVLAEDGSVLASVTQRRAKRRTAEALLRSVVQLARDAMVPVEEETRVGDAWSSYMRWDPSAPYLRAPMTSAPEAEARLSAAGFEVSAGAEGPSLRRKLPPPPFSRVRDALVEACVIALFLALLYAVLGLLNPFLLAAIVLAQIPFLGCVYLLRPVHTTGAPRPSLLQAALRLGDDDRLELDGETLTFRSRRGLRWRKRTIPLRSIVGLNASSSLDYGRRARWIPARLCVVTNDRTEWLDFRIDEDTADDLADWIAHRLGGSQHREARGAA